MNQKNGKSEKEKSSGFSTAIFILIAVLLSASEILISGNFYYTKDGLLKALRGCDSKISEIVKIIPGTIEPSEITVKNVNGTEAVYYMDSNFMFDYRIWKKCE